MRSIAISEGDSTAMVKLINNFLSFENESKVKLIIANSHYTCSIKDHPIDTLFKKMTLNNLDSPIINELDEEDLEIIRKNSELVNLLAQGVILLNDSLLLNERSKLIGELAFYNLKYKESVLEIGSGTGTFGLLLSFLYPNSNIYLNEIDSSLLNHIDSRINTYNKFLILNNIKVVQGEIDKTNTSFKADLIILRNTLHHFEQKNEMLSDIKKNMTDHSRLCIFEGLKNDNDPLYVCNKKMTYKGIKRLMRKNNFKLIRKVKNDKRVLMMYSKK